MKKIFLMSAFLMQVGGFAQCIITGSSQAQLNQPETYSVENDNAQCTDCHLWAAVGGNSSIEGEFRKNTVTINPIAGGKTVLTLSILTAQGFSQCSKSIDIVGGATSNNSTPVSVSTNKKLACDIDVSNYKEVAYSDKVVSFFPIRQEQEQGKFKYLWVAVYLNGDKKESTDKVPRFGYSEENPIVDVTIKVTSDRCIKTLSKNYDATFWKNFK